jgi:hypothetical protein
MLERRSWTTVNLALKFLLECHCLCPVRVLGRHRRDGRRVGDRDDRGTDRNEREISR